MTWLKVNCSMFRYATAENIDQGINAIGETKVSNIQTYDIKLHL